MKKTILTSFKGKLYQYRKVTIKGRKFVEIVPFVSGNKFIPKRSQIEQVKEKNG